MLLVAWVLDSFPYTSALIIWRLIGLISNIPSTLQLQPPPLDDSDMRQGLARASNCTGQVRFCNQRLIHCQAIAHKGISIQPQAREWESMLELPSTSLGSKQANSAHQRRYLINCFNGYFTVGWEVALGYPIGNLL